MSASGRSRTLAEVRPVVHRGMTAFDPKRTLASKHGAAVGAADIRLLGGPCRPNIDADGPPHVGSGRWVAMEFDSIRPVISGVVGGIIATWLTSRWARNLPASYNGRSRDVLLRQHRPAIWTANVLFFVGLCFGVALYRIGSFANT